MITIVGVGHVFDIADQVGQVIRTRQPGVVGVELDKARYEALLDRHVREDTGGLYRLFAHFQRRIARQYGVEVGDEMLAATRAAQAVGADVAFLDMDSSFVLARLWSSMKFEERVKLFVSTFFSMFMGKKQVERELERFDQNSYSYIEEFANQFPSAKRVLIDDRDGHMAEGLRKLTSRYDKIVAVVGDGHVDGIQKRLADLGPEVIRLHDLRTMSPSSNASTSFTVVVR